MVEVLEALAEVMWMMFLFYISFFWGGGGCSFGGAAITRVDHQYAVGNTRLVYLYIITF